MIQITQVLVSLAVATAIWVRVMALVDCSWSFLVIIQSLHAVIGVSLFIIFNALPVFQRNGVALGIGICLAPITAFLLLSRERFGHNRQK
jgi:hypothetical protein